MTWRKVVAWLAVPIYLISQLWTLYADRSMGFPFDLVEGTTLGLGFLLYTVVGAFLVGRRPDNIVGWIMVAIGTTAAVGVGLETYAAWVMDRRGVPDPIAILGFWLNSWAWFPLLALFLVYLPLVFPDGRLLSPRWRIPAVTTALGVAVSAAMGALTETLEGQDPHVYSIPNPIGIDGLVSVEESGVFVIVAGTFAFGLLSGLASLVVRYRRGTPQERQQLKWLLFPVVVIALTFPFEAGIAQPVPVVSEVLFAVGLIGMPLAIGVAVLRYRLYEVDRILSRTVSYGLVTAALVAVYLGLVFVLRRVLPFEGPFAVAASTLAVAALFNPVRRRVQAVVDRRFNRSRYVAERVLETFSVRLRRQMDLTDLVDHLRLVALEVTEPASLSIWLRSDEVPTVGGGRRESETS
ncbi:hypothetical protein BH23ACT5_BH23ACT5_17310 [soil metagenome]